MTGSTATVDQPMYEIDIPTERLPVPEIPFRVTGEMFTMRQPKLTAAVTLIALLDVEDNHPRFDAFLAGARVTEALWALIDYIKDEDPEPELLDDGEPNPQAGRLRGRARLLQRLRSPTDELDIVHLAQLFGTIVGATFHRPTTPLPASSAKPDNGGTDSEAATSEPPAATSGTSTPPRSSQPPRTSPAKRGNKSGKRRPAGARR